MYLFHGNLFIISASTLISLINVETRLLILVFFHRPRLLIFEIFSTLHSSFVAVIYYFFFPKNTTLHVYSNLVH